MRFDAGASCSLEISEMVLTKHRDHVESEEGPVSALSKDASSPGISTESVKMELRPCSRSSTAWSKKIPSHPGSSRKWVLISGL